ncbi:hypothetical protein NYZ94_00145 (plasmid) [Ligilactobacillus salivarius]|nr:hypothetical protein NYZ94_00145 [Ligilactobacillus salivarius]
MSNSKFGIFIEKDDKVVGKFITSKQLGRVDKFEMNNDYNSEYWQDELAPETHFYLKLVKDYDLENVDELSKNTDIEYSNLDDLKDDRSTFAKVVRLTAVFVKGQWLFLENGTTKHVRGYQYNNMMDYGAGLFKYEFREMTESSLLATVKYARDIREIIERDNIYYLYATQAELDRQIALLESEDIALRTAFVKTVLTYGLNTVSRVMLQDFPERNIGYLDDYLESLNMKLHKKYHRELKRRGLI